MPECQDIRFKLPWSRGSFDAVLGWGHKPSADKARAFAEKEGLPYLALEDGFLRSVRLGRDGEPALSLVVDPVGIYYDARQPSLLENFLQHKGWETSELLERAAFVRRWLVDERLSKYNHAPDLNVWEDSDRERVLVVDQTWDDASVGGGLADEKSFQQMFEAALEENPQAQVVIKTHPEVVSGHRPGYYGKIPDHSRLSVLTDNINPWSVLKGVSSVYTATSQLGFEALLADKKVRCFGVPFYAGWGLTEDEQKCCRRSRRRSLDELVAAAYLKYARYVDPVRGEPCGIEVIIALLSDRRRQYLRTYGKTVCSGMSLWKRSFLPRFVAANRKGVVFVRPPEKAIEKAITLNASWTLWASKETQVLRARANVSGVKMVRVEDAFLRSSGLGSDLARPWSLVLDDEGIYYDATRPSRLENLLNETDFPAGLLVRAKILKKTILERGITKYNISYGDFDFKKPREKVTILVPGQVEDDASILRGSPEIRNNLELLRRVRERRPEAFILFKPHPDVVAGNRRGTVAESEALCYCDAVVTNAAMHRLLEQVDEVHTLTSLTGFEALLRGIRVVNYGCPFYAGWGLTEDVIPLPRRKRALTLEQLVAGALILYPVYVDPKTRQVCSPEHLLERLAAPKKAVQCPPFKTRVIRFFQRLKG
ncbi:MAG: capsular polysaccharide biosynthesis protein [Deltaproteobacteria bacterium]|nr:capsular polysaccharide biosynthesis protein [Deltaproteobacteria bacterium]